MPHFADSTATGAPARAVALVHAARGIHADCAVPGLPDRSIVRAPIAGQAAEATARALAARNAASPAMALGDALDAASASVYLASDAARYVTGAGTVVDGGPSRSCPSVPALAGA